MILKIVIKEDFKCPMKAVLALLLLFYFIIIIIILLLVLYFKLTKN